MAKPAAHTEWTICFMKFVEAVLCLICLLYHIQGVFYAVVPVPHAILFCSSFGGFLILNLAQVLAPVSGQTSPPGVDLIFTCIGIVLFFSDTCLVMYFVAIDENLLNATDVEEENDPFFQNCRQQGLYALIACNFFLMHAVISMDRLHFAKKGVTEDRMKDIDDVDADIDPEDNMQLHLFFLDWLVQLWNTKCCILVWNFFMDVLIYCTKPLRVILNKRRRRRRKRRRRRRSSNLGSSSSMMIDTLDGGFKSKMTVYADPILNSLLAQKRNISKDDLKQTELTAPTSSNKTGQTKRAHF